jgi:hypothetical protein
MIQGQPEQIVSKTTSPKVIRAKWTIVVTQAIEHLLCKHKALTSNFSTTKGKKKRTKEIDFLLQPSKKNTVLLHAEGILA